jgi:hypothetical protein
MWPFTTPAENPEMAPEGLSPRSPLSVVDRVFDTPVPASTEKLSAEPKSIVGTEATAGEATDSVSSEPRRSAIKEFFMLR